MMLLPILLLINVVKTETFAEKLQTFVNETVSSFKMTRSLYNFNIIIAYWIHSQQDCQGW